MRDQIIIRMPVDVNTDVVQWIKLGDSIIPTVNQNRLQEIVEYIAGAKVIVLAPGDDVLLTHVSIPTTNKQRLLKAIPYALEEELAGDVDLLHFAIGATDESGKTPVAVVAKRTMDGWQEKLRAAGLVAEAIVPEVLTLPIEEDHWSLLLETQGALLRTGAHTGLAIDANNIAFILPLTINKAEPKPAQLQCWNNTVEQDLRALAAEEIEVLQQPAQNGLLELLASKLEISKTINLLQGSYSHREQLGKLWRPWRFAASLAGVWFVMQLVIAVTQSVQLETQNEALKAEAIDIYKENFPDAKNISRPRVQLAQKLAELKGGSATSGEAVFLNLLSDSGKAFQQTSGLVLRSVRYKNGVLDVEIDVPNLQALDRLKQQLANNEGMTVEIQSAASRNNKVQGRLQIKGQAS